MKEFAVVGAGVMGAGIAAELAKAGKNVMLFDSYPAALVRAQKEILPLAVFQTIKDKKFVYRSREAVRAVLERISFFETTPENLKNVASADAVIEAIKENANLKIALYQELERFLSPEAPIFTNTSTLQIGRLAVGLKYPRRFAGLHFFNPVSAMPPVEAILHKGNLPFYTIDIEKSVIDIANLLGKRLFWAPDLPGFIVNRLLVRMVDLSCKAAASGADFKKVNKVFTTGEWFSDPIAKSIVEEFLNAARDLIAKDRGHELLGVSEEKFKENVDSLMKVGTAMPKGPYEMIALMDGGKNPEVKFEMGPFKLIDHVGTDVAADCCRMLKLQEPDRWEVPEILEQMIKVGKLGKKSGEGFYSYKETVKLEIAPDKSCARISWTGRKLPLYLVKELKKKLGLAKYSGAKSVILEINRQRGADIDEFLLALLSEEAARYAINIWQPAIREATDYPGPIIAAIKGSALGGAYEWALACDYIIAERKAKIGLVELQRGIKPGGGGTQTLTRRVGAARALRMILRGATLQELGEEVGPPWVDEAVDKITEERLMELAARGIPKKDRSPLRYTIWDWKDKVVEIFNALKFWNGYPPASLYLAVKSIWEGNKKSFFLGTSEYEFNNVIAAFKTDDALRMIIEFLEKRFQKKDKEED